MAFILLCVSCLLACFLMLEVYLHTRTRKRLKVSRISANRRLNEKLDKLHELSQEKGYRHHFEMLCKQLAAENSRLGSLVDFDGKISPLSFRSSFLIRPHDPGSYRADEPVRVCRLLVKPHAYDMMLDYDFKEFPNIIPPVSRAIARGMTKKLEDKLTAQVSESLAREAATR